MAIRLFLLTFLNPVLGKFLPKQLNSPPVNDFFMRETLSSQAKLTFGKLTANTGAPSHLPTSVSRHQSHLHTRLRMEIHDWMR